MNIIDRLEKLVEKLVEQPFARFFKPQLHPADLAKDIAWAMEAGLTADGRGGYIAPNFYQIQLSPADYEALGKDSNLNAEIESIKAYLTSLMLETGVNLTAPLRVQIEAQANAPSGRAVIRAEHLQAEPTSDTHPLNP